MERRSVKIGMQVGIRPASRRTAWGERVATVRALIDRPGYRSCRAIVEYADTGACAEMPLARLAPLRKT